MTFLISVFIMSCSRVNDKIQNFIEPNTELYQITDDFVGLLQTTYETYGMLGGLEHKKYTKDSLYRVMPFGRLINVRIESVVNDDEYETLKNKIKKHYENNIYVNDVYICRKGTIMIDCRN